MLITEIVRIDAAAPDRAVLEAAARVLASGGLVGFPTETFYGLGAAALDAGAARRIFELKGRPRSSPLLVLVDSLEMARRIADVPERARSLIARHWPGPLTLVLPARPGLPDEVTASTGTVGVRVSAHPVARGLVAALGAPVTAPSANLSGASPPTVAGDVVRAFADRIELVLDGGATAGGPPSTVLDVTVEPPRVIRAGAVRV
ncbi:MAG: threonylcarbamoyl-AMP synthase [Candidatus Rokubacteria bacterium]|nr:threonylcarbamoyl-AMP synthase [Candidatus Rokubacteria bacterium]